MDSEKRKVNESIIIVRIKDDKKLCINSVKISTFFDKLLKEKVAVIKIFWPIYRVTLQINSKEIVLLIRGNMIKIKGLTFKTNINIEKEVDKLFFSSKMYKKN